MNKSNCNGSGLKWRMNIDNESLQIVNEYVWMYKSK